MANKSEKELEMPDGYEVVISKWQGGKHCNKAVPLFIDQMDIKKDKEKFIGRIILQATKVLEESLKDY